MSFEGKAEYAKSGRAGCKKCKEKISEQSLRLARMVNSPFTDGKVPQWFHFTCFWTKKFPVSDSSQFQGYGDLKPADQERIKGKIGTGVDGGAGGAKSSTVTLPIGCPELIIEYAKSSRSECRNCLESIQKGEIRCGAMRPSDSGKVSFDVPHWCHRKCFVEIIQTDDYAEVPLDKIVPEMFTGHQLIKAEDKKDFLTFLDSAREVNGFQKLGGKGSKKRKAGATEESASKKAKSEEEQATAEKMKKQSEHLWNIRSGIKSLPRNTMKLMLEQNGLNSSGGQETLEARLADALAYGALQKCPECKCNSWETKEDGYHCKGNIDEFSPCIYVTRTPPVKKFKIDKALVSEVTFLKKFKTSTTPRIFDPTAIALAETRAKKRNEPTVPSIRPSSSAPANPNKKIIIATCGKLLRSNRDCKELVQQLGMTWHAGKIGSHVTCVVSTDAEFSKPAQTQKIKDAIKFSVPIVKEGFLTDCEKSGKCALLEPHLIACSSTVIEPSLENTRRAAFELGKSAGKEHEKLIMKGRAAIEIKKSDTEFGHLVDSHHVLDCGGTVWSASLSYVNTRDNFNSYYKMQILEKDGGGQPWILWKSWGRVGTAIGRSSVNNCFNKNGAMSAFAEKFLEKTGNNWEDRENFKKQSGKFNYVNVAYAEDVKDLTEQMKDAVTESKLDPHVQDLIRLLFDTNAMEQTMKELDIDLKKMPLGRLNRKSIEEAFIVLSDLEKALNSDDEKAKQKAIHLSSNKFYQIIPHDFGMKAPPLINSHEMVKAKVELVESLLEIELTSRMIKTETKVKEEEVHPVDSLYGKLNTDIKPVPRDSKTFSMVETYAQNTHAATHSQYTLEIENVYEVRRSGEKAAYKKHKSLHNKRLLWHGSRLTNYPGILSEGLRIAPPSAPATGYMFGKGVYFADMVSKSANYCSTSHAQPTGLLLLSEVALGSMYECTQAQYVVGHNQDHAKDKDANGNIIKLPEGKHSTFGVGQTMPHKDEAETTDDGVLVPLGKPTKSGQNSSLLYNEYIVYDTSQIKMKYLIRAKFKFKNRRW